MSYDPFRMPPVTAGHKHSLLSLGAKALGFQLQFCDHLMHSLPVEGAFAPHSNISQGADVAETKHNLTCQQGGRDWPSEKEPDVEVMI